MRLPIALAVALLTAPALHGQTPQPSPPAPVYPTITVSGTLPAGTYQLVPAGDVAAWKTHAATVAKVRQLAQQLLDATAPPAPAPPAPDPPPPKPAPTSAGPLWLVVVETPAGAPMRGSYFADAALQARIKIKAHRFRIVDSAVRDASGNVPADVAPYLALAAGKALPQLYLVDAHGTRLYGGELPATPAELVALLQSLGG